MGIAGQREREWGQERGLARERREGKSWRDMHRGEGGK